MRRKRPFHLSAGFARFPLPLLPTRHAARVKRLSLPHNAKVGEMGLFKHPFFICGGLVTSTTVNISFIEGIFPFLKTDYPGVLNLMWSRRRHYRLLPSLQYISHKPTKPQLIEKAVICHPGPPGVFAQQPHFTRPTTIFDSRSLSPTRTRTHVFRSAAQTFISEYSLALGRWMEVPFISRQRETNPPKTGISGKGRVETPRRLGKK